MEHLLSLADVSKKELYDVLDLADKLKKLQKKGVFTPYLRNKTLGMIFTKPSTRTRISFETGMAQLGGTALYLNVNDMQLGRGELIKDTARVLSRYLDGIMIRTYAHSDLEELVAYGSIPIINGLTDYVHPCQVLADLQTIREYKGTLEGLKICYIGAGNNMANSLINGAILAGMEVACACPEGYLPNEEICTKAEATGRFRLTQDVLAASKDADVLVTDVWASMGEEGEAQHRKSIFAGIYQIDDRTMKMAKPDAMVLHCLPAHRGEEISEKQFELHADEIFDEAENRLHAQKAILVTLMKDR